MSSKLIFYTVMILIGGTTSCKVIKPYQPPSEQLNGLYRDVNTSDTTSIADFHYEDIFTDTILQNLIREGIQKSLNLQIAYTRIQQAQAYFEQSRLAFYPSLNASLSATSARVTNSQINNRISSAQQYQVGLSTSWEADIWGRLRSTKRANLAALLQSEAAARAVQTDLVGNIANYYYSLLALDRELAITQMTVQNWISTVNIMKALKEAAIVTGAAVVQSEASRYAAEVTIPDIKQNIRETENALSILLARNPGPVERSRLEDQHPVSLLQTGVPALLLSNRPDVQAAEYNYRYTFELTNVAPTYFYPSLTITASGGLAALNISNLFTPGALIGSITGGLTQPIFSQGANRARLKAAQAQQNEALFTFRNTLLTAGQEVSNFLSSYQTALEKTNARDSQLVNLQKSVEYTQELVRYSSANYTEVITAQQSLLAAQLNQVGDRLQQLQAIVNLYRALGGGWK
ncbi:MAG TPA: efflux transporter outer membrane subunit [Flavisolibacter sp.]|nr:efflux transporter outer membrane subunit [Flavisolibacter sp.]